MIKRLFVYMCTEGPTETLNGTWKVSARVSDDEVKVYEDNFFFEDFENAAKFMKDVNYSPTALTFDVETGEQF